MTREQSGAGTGKLGLRVAKLVIMAVGLITLAVLGQMAMQDQDTDTVQPEGLDRPGAVDANDVTNLTLNSGSNETTEFVSASETNQAEMLVNVSLAQAEYPGCNSHG